MFEAGQFDQRVFGRFTRMKKVYGNDSTFLCFYQFYVVKVLSQIFGKTISRVRAQPDVNNYW
jgi:hypothetical protein